MINCLAICINYRSIVDSLTNKLEIITVAELCIGADSERHALDIVIAKSEKEHKASDGWQHDEGHINVITKSDVLNMLDVLLD